MQATHSADTSGQGVVAFSPGDFAPVAAALFSCSLLHAAVVCVVVAMAAWPSHAQAQAGRYERFNRSGTMFGPRRFGQPFRPRERQFTDSLERSSSGAFMGIRRPTGNPGARGALDEARRTRSTQWLLNPPASPPEAGRRESPPVLTAPGAPEQGSEMALPFQEGVAEPLQPAETLQGPQFPATELPQAGQTEAVPETIPAEIPTGSQVPETLGQPFVSGEELPGTGRAAIGAGQPAILPGEPSPALGTGPGGFASSESSLPPVTRWSSSFSPRRQSTRIAIRLLDDDQLSQVLSARINRMLGEAVRRPIRVHLAGGKAVVEGAVTSEDRRAVVNNLLLIEPGIWEVENRLEVEPAEPAGR